jgi:cytochrome c biogenesis protein CcmG/thiol:disulfide interchange protein DsbE
MLAILALVISACSTTGGDPSSIPELPSATPDDVSALLAESGRPVVLNVWASWCAPCRSEAPLLRSAHARWGSEVRFIGIDVRDDQAGAREFIAEFGLGGFEHLFDREGRIPGALGGLGVPHTYFFAPGGERIALHNGVIDERTLALQIDELLRRG